MSSTSSRPRTPTPWTESSPSCSSDCAGPADDDDSGDDDDATGDDDDSGGDDDDATGVPCPGGPWTCLEMEVSNATWDNVGAGPLVDVP
ncbi:MAG: hypothetical protein KDA24_11190 [Deltaproteobacteria bacterium]|nr:hypothetical protein [Deltaproteobacteria bacterium]